MALCLHGVPYSQHASSASGGACAAHGSVAILLDLVGRGGADQNEPLRYVGAAADAAAGAPWRARRPELGVGVLVGWGWLRLPQWRRSRVGMLKGVGNHMNEVVMQALTGHGLVWSFERNTHTRTHTVVSGQHASGERGEVCD